jgi:hypothetical protein
LLPVWRRGWATEKLLEYSVQRIALGAAQHFEHHHQAEAETDIRLKQETMQPKQHLHGNLC